MYQLPKLKYRRDILVAAGALQQFQTPRDGAQGNIAF
jgi:hypothetical protein